MVVYAINRLEVNASIVEQILDSVRADRRTFVLEPEAKEALRAYGVPTVEGRFCPTLDDAEIAAGELGYPLAIKIVSPLALHKSELGGVKLGIASEKALQEAYIAIMAAAAGRAIPADSVRGVLVERMAQGYEIIIGATHDPQFGPLMMFGLGGIFVEVLKDVSYRLAPLSAWDAQDMIREIKAYPLLAGARGGRPVDEEALANVLVSVSHLVDDFREIKELDLNPVFVDGGLIAVADARIIIEGVT